MNKPWIVTQVSDNQDGITKKTIGYGSMEAAIKGMKDQVQRLFVHLAAEYDKRGEEYDIQISNVDELTTNIVDGEEDFYSLTVEELVFELGEETVSDPEAAFIQSKLDRYLDEQALDLNEEQRRLSLNAAQSWLSYSFDEALVESVHNALITTTIIAPKTEEEN